MEPPNNGHVGTRHSSFIETLSSPNLLYSKYESECLGPQSVSVIGRFSPLSEVPLYTSRWQVTYLNGVDNVCLVEHDK